MVCWLVVWLRGSLSLSRGFGVRFVVVRGCAEFVLAGLVGSGGSGLRGRRRSMALSGGHFQETNKKVGARSSSTGTWDMPAGAFAPASAARALPFFFRLRRRGVRGGFTEISPPPHLY